ncbi:MAG TPA: hypothetical protein VI957_03390, partial [Candidatus Paceibacterota bacterium]
RIKRRRAGFTADWDLHPTPKESQVYRLSLPIGKRRFTRSRLAAAVLLFAAYKVSGFMHALRDLF